MARKTPTINTGSSADISFLLLTFFLLTSNISTEQGIPRRLPPPSDKEEIVDIKERNVLVVQVNFLDEIFVGSGAIPVTELKNVAKNFLLNPNNDPKLPEKEVREIDHMGEYTISKGVISLVNDQSTSYNMYVQVQNELQRAVNEIRDDVSSQYFGKKYDLLDTAFQRAVQKAVPMNISEAPPRDYNQQQ
ncbi:biopolymer transporter ExbD [Bacteroidales bacterium OttesenSCG-928-B11]|nr:biopolymer transporter ExbD [Bacteroidales bacterium OttesenSCG-928-E04]MDL2309106.1 biopolymer transporter ExbD [Bacteroidales bacterium OttesenSCG-928-C03]MDL2312939.1 biopolymer transporter ExbD [Bacteroidales bacterium OttesenSCG-928-B11]MDL2326669.1 biopolymer transporter ExbD [Bacteroidales bacterium OttesenSCG-928-A14]